MARSEKSKKRKRAKSKSRPKATKAEAGAAKATKASDEPPAAEPTQTLAEPLPQALGSRRDRWVARLVVAAAAALAFGRALPFGLVTDWYDDRLVRDNPLVTDPSFAHLTEVLAAPHFFAYQPLHLLSYWVDAPWFGTSGPALHVVALMMWVAAVIALLEASWALRLSLVGGAAATLLVALHPVQVEAVVWASGRDSILALGFSALAVTAHAKSERPFDRGSLLSLLAYGAACLSKSTAVPLPLVLLGADLLLLGRPVRGSLVRLLPSALVAAALGLVQFLIWDDAQMVRESSHPVALVGATVGHYLATAVWPAALSPVYPIERGEGFAAWSALVGPLALAALAALAWRFRSRRLGFAVFAFVVLIAPASNVIPVYYQWQDRYLSLALWPLAFMVGAFLDTLPKRPVAVGVAAVLAGALGVRAAQYSGEWTDGLRLFEHAAATQPHAFYAWLNLGHARRARGHREGAIAAYGQATEVSNLRVAHQARFSTVMELDEARHGLTPRAESVLPLYTRSMTDVDGLRAMAGMLADQGYRSTVMLVLDQSLALEPIAQDRLEQAALVQLRRGNPWLSDYYVSRLPNPPVTPELRARHGLGPDDP